ncbi:hypothetical protein ACFOGJ_29755 [Marinibaculum pumilum]|uniref:Uncharacterized protein n=1 Tax=Marinibaculum pumilum TaxID=1766165 RepID=A0ABV7LAM8_9PROT
MDRNTGSGTVKPPQKDRTAPARKPRKDGRIDLDRVSGGGFTSPDGDTL